MKSKEQMGTPHTRSLLRWAQGWIVQSSGGMDKASPELQAALKAIEEALYLLGDPSGLYYLGQTEREAANYMAVNYHD